MQDKKNVKTRPGQKKVETSREMKKMRRRDA